MCGIAMWVKGVREMKRLWVFSSGPKHVLVCECFVCVCVCMYNVCVCECCVSVCVGEIGVAFETMGTGRLNYNSCFRFYLLKTCPVQGELVA